MANGPMKHFNSDQTAASWQVLDVEISVNGDQVTTESKHRFDIENLQTEGEQNYEIEYSHVLSISRDGANHTVESPDHIQTAPIADNIGEGTITLEAGETFNEDDMERLRDSSTWEDDRIYTFTVDNLEEGDNVKIDAYTVVRPVGTRQTSGGQTVEHPGKSEAFADQDI